ncbi:hypothetical protein [uncultured Variovorax sp.]|uniref:hypothetical protein n=1 Tax=uncultured Variovorax sp. TaxID=114708 RepID=UPI0026064D8D|nr:hypothetical protein [uncultured Variovorax sp.]
MTTAIHSDRSRTLNAWLKADEKALTQAIDAGLDIHETAQALRREPLSVLRHLSDVGPFVFEQGTEEWVEFMSMALSGIPVQDVIAWCVASDDRMPYELLDAMRSGLDLRCGFELARELHITIVSTDHLMDLDWLMAQPQIVQAGYGAAAGRVLARYDALTPSTLKTEVLGLAPAEAAWPGMCGLNTRRGRAHASRDAGVRLSKPRKASRSTKSKPKIRNKWAYANYLKNKRAAARA